MVDDSMTGDTMTGDTMTGAEPPERMRPLAGRRAVREAMAALRGAWRALGEDDAARAEALAARLCALPPVSVRPDDENAAETFTRLLLDPTYQLK